MRFTVHKDVMVAMRDGVELATDLWVPDTTPAPTLLVRLPYSKDLPALLGYGLVPNLFALVEAGLRGGLPGLPGHVPVGRRLHPDAERAGRRRRHRRLAARPAVVRRQHRHLRPVLPGVRAVGQRDRVRPGAGDRALRHHDRLLHHAVVLRRRRPVLALDPVVVHDDGAGRGAAPARPGRRRPAAAGRPERHAGRPAAAPGGAAAEPPAGAGEGVALVVRAAEPTPAATSSGRTCPCSTGPSR